MIHASSLPIPWSARDLEVAIWDFNGTLIDDLDHVVHTVNVQLARRGLRTITVERYRAVFGFPVEEYYRRIGLDPSAESMAEMAAEFYEEYVPGLLDCALHAGAIEALVAFRNAGLRQFVLSAMEEALLRSAVDRLGIAGFFDAVYGLAHLEADSKISRGRELLGDHDVGPKSALLIGDTDHDAEVADALGVSVVLIAQGHQAAARLEATGRGVFDGLTSLIAAVTRVA